MQIGTADRSGFLLQAVTHVFCSPLQRIGVAEPGEEASMTSDAIPASVTAQDSRRESVCGGMPPS